MESMAFSDTELPLIIDSVDTNETMLRPTIEARFTQELQLKPTDAVLEIGTGSGYQAALLGHLAQQVTSVEINRTLRSEERRVGKEGRSRWSQSREKDKETSATRESR